MVEEGPRRSGRSTQSLDAAHEAAAAGGNFALFVCRNNDAALWAKNHLRAHSVGASARTIVVMPYEIVRARGFVFDVAVIDDADQYSERELADLEEAIAPALTPKAKIFEIRELREETDDE